MKCVVNWISLRIHARSRNTQPHLNPTELFELHEKSPARSRSMEDDESRNARRNADQNPEWWDFSQLVKIEKLKFLGIMRYKFELRLWSNLNSSVSRGTNSNPDFGLIWMWSWIKSSNNSRFRFAFRRSFRFSSSSCRERAVFFICLGGSVNLVSKFQGQPGTTTVNLVLKHDFNPNGMKFYLESPWVSVLSWLNITDYFPRNSRHCCGPDRNGSNWDVRDIDKLSWDL